MEELRPGQKRKLGVKSKNKRTNPDHPIHAPAMPSTQRALELEEELQAVQKGVTKVELRELTLIEYLCRRGRPMKFIHDEINFIRDVNKRPTMSYDSFLALRDRFPDYFRSCDTWRESADDAVEASLFEVATGGITYEEKAIVVSDGKDSGSHVETHLVKKKFHGNVLAQQFWLERRRPEKWGKQALKDAFTDMPDEELIALVQEALQNRKKNQQTQTVEDQNDGKEE